MGGVGRRRRRRDTTDEREPFVLSPGPRAGRLFDSVEGVEVSRDSSRSSVDERVGASSGLLDAALDHVDGQHLAPLVIRTDVPVNVAAQFTPVAAVGTLEARLLPARVQQVPAEAVLPLEAAVAARATVAQVKDLERLQQDTLEL